MQKKRDNDKRSVMQKLRADGGGVQWERRTKGT